VVEGLGYNNFVLANNYQRTHFLSDQGNFEYTTVIY